MELNVFNTKIPVRDRSQRPAVSLKADDDNSGSLAILNKYGKNIVVLSKLKADDSGQFLWLTSRVKLSAY